MSRGRGRGRIRFGGSRDSALADMLDETREDLGLSHTQMELLHAESGSALYPPLQLPQPEPLTDRDAYLIQRQRVLAHKLENLYHPWGHDATMPDSTNPAAFVHVTMPETQKAGEVFVPNELQSNTLSGGVRSANASNQRNIMQPRAFESVFKSLEAQEQKQADKSKGADDDDDGDMEEQDEDLGDDMNDYTFDYYDSDAASEDGDEEVFF
uniref:DNA-directed RNA polymerase III subunit n=1 Tax=Globisporangium ultimum (strain ATCC 200006 / CBS 805.95 / DAOM BR144) TaxID=431595 RepID=K3WSA6_GLOUD